MTNIRYELLKCNTLYRLKRKPISQFPLSLVMQSSHFQNDELKSGNLSSAEYDKTTFFCLRGVDKYNRI